MMVGAALMLIESPLRTVEPLLSAAVTENVIVPAAVGVPSRKPVEVRDKPFCGSCDDVNVNDPPGTVSLAVNCSMG